MPSSILVCPDTLTERDHAALERAVKEGAFDVGPLRWRVNLNESQGARVLLCRLEESVRIEIDPAY